MGAQGPRESGAGKGGAVGWSGGVGPDMRRLPTDGDRLSFVKCLDARGQSYFKHSFSMSAISISMSANIP